jgi:endonuclease/exonuclease/phosphatase family metal-dependent hydrolase
MVELSLASFNMHYGVRPGPAPHTSFDVTAALATLDADVLVIQEVWRPDDGPSAVDDAARELGMAIHHHELGRATIRARWPHFATGVHSEGTIGLAIVTDLSTRILERIPLGPTIGDAIPNRSVMRATLDVEGVPVQLVAVHLSSRLPLAPPIQLRRLARGVPPPGVPAVVAGDCNFWGPGVRTFFRGWRRAVRGRTWPAAHPHSQIDHVLVRPADVEVLDGRVLPDLGSDHRPVRVELRIPSRSGGATA